MTTTGASFSGNDLAKGHTELLPPRDFVAWVKGWPGPCVVRFGGLGSVMGWTCESNFVSIWRKMNSEQSAADVHAPGEPPPGAADVYAPGALEGALEPGRRLNGFILGWRKIGAGSLALSLAIHAGLIVLAGLVVWTQVVSERQVDFLPGGGTQQGADASREVAHQIQQKKKSKLNKMPPMKKVVSTSLNAALTLPELPPDLLEVADMGAMLGAGKLGSGGFGSSGAGGGFGSGYGTGGMRGIAFKPVMMFGRDLKAKKIAVVMDVSRSMTKYLPIVAKELDKVGRNSPLILYFGCGLSTPKNKDDIDDKVYKAQGPEFDRFWQLWQGKTPLNTPAAERKLLKYDRDLPMPLKPIYEQMVKRPHTYFIDFNGIVYSSYALTCKEVMEADVIYWFSDFQDRVDEPMMNDVLKVLKKRKQRLVMHASIQGRSFEKVRDAVCYPTGGEVLDTRVE